MTVIEHRLQAKFIDLDFSRADVGSAGKHSQFFLKHHQNLARLMLQEGYVLAIEYELLCAQLSLMVRENPSNPENLPSIRRALLFARLFEWSSQTLNLTWLDNLRLQNDIRLLREWLRLNGILLVENSECSLELASQKGYEQIIQSETQAWNFTRQILQRARRLLVVAGYFFSDIESYKNTIQCLDYVAKPIISYLTWLFFLPRLVLNSYLCAKHVIPGFWMQQQEKDLGVLSRLSLQLQQHGFEFVNDAMWVGVGLLNGFVLIGAWSPLALYASIALQSVDVLMRSIKMHLRLSPLERAVSQYQNLLRKEGISAEEKQSIATHLAKLSERMQYEQKQLLLSVVGSAIILASLLIALPVLAIHPLIPLIGATSAVLSSFVYYFMNESQKQTKPLSQLQPFDHPPQQTCLIKRFGLFSTLDNRQEPRLELCTAKPG